MTPRGSRPSPTGASRSTGRPGKLGNLVEKLSGAPAVGATGIGHTRWATHGRPTELNAHPQTDCTGQIVVVHNGIFENFAERKAALAKAGHRFHSETDTEVFAHEVEAAFQGDLDAAVRAAVRKLTGAYAVLVSSSREPGVLVAARSGPPIVLGLGDGENYVASDPVALVPWTRDVIFLEDGDVARVDAKGVAIHNAEGARLERPVHRIMWDAVAAEKGGYRHFMAKEIHEQPTAVAETLRREGLARDGELYIDSPLLTPEKVQGYDRVLLLACGTSWHSAPRREVPHRGHGPDSRSRSTTAASSATGGRSWTRKTLTIGISQSGETADTVAALSEARRSGSADRRDRERARKPDRANGRRRLATHAGPEIGVASTKAFTTQLAVLYLLAAQAARLAGSRARAFARGAAAPSRTFPRRSATPSRSSPRSRSLPAATSTRATSCSWAAGSTIPVALEGALKLKEISYIHAEGYPAGEMKHGPIALVDENLPVFVLAPHDAWREKTLSNLREVKSRDGIAIVLGTRPDDEVGGDRRPRASWFPETIPELQPIISVIPLQLFAYHVAVRRGCDVDQPRNLAKSVTVE